MCIGRAKHFWEALAAWRALGQSDDEHVFCNEQGAAVVRWESLSDGVRRASLWISVKHGKTSARLKGAQAYRHHIAIAGIDRAELFQDDDVRMPTRLHDLRGCFVTVALATGRSEAWVSDRTGHTSSPMINRYRRRARRHREAYMGGMLPLVQAIPELSDAYRRLIGTDEPGAVNRCEGKATRDQGVQSVPARGFEPRLEDSKSAVRVRNVARCRKHFPARYI